MAKVSQRVPKTSQRLPKVSRKVIKMHPKIDVRKRVPKSSDFGINVLCFLAPFWSHFPSKMHPKIYAKIDAEKNMKFHKKT